MLSTQVQCQGCPFWCCSVQNKTNWTGQHAKRLEIWLFHGVSVNEIDWIFYWTILVPWLELGLALLDLSCGISTGIDSPGHSVPCASMPNPIVWTKRFCEGTKKHHKERHDMVTNRRVNKMHLRQSGNLGLILSPLLRPAPLDYYVSYCWGWRALQTRSPSSAVANVMVQSAGLRRSERMRLSRLIDAFCFSTCSTAGGIMPAENLYANDCTIIPQNWQLTHDSQKMVQLVIQTALEKEIFLPRKKWP